MLPPPVGELFFATDLETLAPVALKQCCICKNWLESTQFGLRKRKADPKAKRGGPPGLRLFSTCRNCANAKARKWYVANRDRALAGMRASRAASTPEVRAAKSHFRSMWKYGLKPEDYLRMFKAQDGLCAICRRPERRKNCERLSVDHVHGSKPIQIRELLCHDCNTGIGKFCEDTELLKAAIAYLEKHKR